jgi:N-acetylneuraminate synthase
VTRPAPAAAATIAGRRIGPSEPPFVIAELSANHLGRIERALASIEAAAEAGADAVKFQTYTPDTLTLDSDAEPFRIRGGLWDGQTLHQLYRSAYTPYDWHQALFDKARACGLIALSTPFDQTAVDLLAGLDAPAYKIASFEIVDLPLIASVARLGRPMIISTGIADFAEIADAVTTARANGCAELVLLHCTSGYPAPVADANLRTMPHMARAFDAVPGLSDHTPGTAVAVAAVALGACVVEKHFTLSRADGGPDAAFSLEPQELARLVADCRAAWEALGEVSYAIKPSERANLGFRRSLFVVRPVAAGEPLTAENVRSIRPGGGLAPRHLPEVIGRTARRALERGEPLSWEMID